MSDYISTYGNQLINQIYYEILYEFDNKEFEGIEGESTLDKIKEVYDNWMDIHYWQFVLDDINTSNTTVLNNIITCY